MEKFRYVRLLLKAITFYLKKKGFDYKISTGVVNQPISGKITLAILTIDVTNLITYLIRVRSRII